MSDSGSHSNVLVVGAGHVGLVTAVGLAKLGHTVVALDRNDELLATLRTGAIPFIEPGLPELLAEVTHAGRLKFTSVYKGNFERSDFVFLCVNTPSTVSGAADLRFVRDAAACIGREIARTEHKPILVNKSTSPSGCRSHPGEGVE